MQERYKPQIPDFTIQNYFCIPAITKVVSLEKLYMKIEKETGYTKEQIQGKSRKRELVYVRHIFTKVLRDKTLLSLAQIGKEINRDHTTVLAGIAVINSRIKMYDDVKQLYQKITSKQAI